jgi:hypothetical protein
MRVSGDVSVDDMAKGLQTVRAIVSKNHAVGVQTICLSDVREVITFPSSGTDAMVWLLRQDNVARTVSAFYARGGPNGNANQFEDIVRQSKSDLRRVFTRVEEGTAFLTSYLDSEQREKVVAFLGRPVTRASPDRPRPGAEGKQAAPSTRRR